MPRYVVSENTPGYMPDDTDPATFDDEDSARVYASDQLSRLLDSICDGDEDGYEGAYAALSIVGSFQTDTCVYVTDTRRAHDLGRVIEIIEEQS